MQKFNWATDGWMPMLVDEAMAVANEHMDQLDNNDLSPLFNMDNYKTFDKRSEDLLAPTIAIYIESEIGIPAIDKLPDQYKDTANEMINKYNEAIKEGYDDVIMDIGKVAKVLRKNPNGWYLDVVEGTDYPGDKEQYWRYHISHPKLQTKKKMREFLQSLASEGKITSQKASLALFQYNPYGGYGHKGYAIGRMITDAGKNDEYKEFIDTLMNSEVK